MPFFLLVLLASEREQQRNVMWSGCVRAVATHTPRVACLLPAPCLTGEHGERAQRFARWVRKEVIRSIIASNINHEAINHTYNFRLPCEASNALVFGLHGSVHQANAIRMNKWTMQKNQQGTIKTYILLKQTCFFIKNNIYI